VCGERTRARLCARRRRRQQRRARVGFFRSRFQSHHPQQQPTKQVIRAALFSPPAFSASKLAVSYLPGVTPHGPMPLPTTTTSGGNGGGGGNGAAPASATTTTTTATRTYTLTHNDLTGALLLSIGPGVNADQVRGLYTRLVRDEVVAEWRFDYAPPAGLVETAEQRRRRHRREQRQQRERARTTANGGGGGGGADAHPTIPTNTSSQPTPSLHVYCHVSGEERWLAPPQLRAFVFRREMALVLSALRAGDRALLSATPELRSAPVYVHFQSHVEHLDTVEAWGTLGDSRSWPGVAFGGFGGGGVGVGGAAAAAAAWDQPLRRWAQGRPLLLALLGATATATDSLSDIDEEDGGGDGGGGGPGGGWEADYWDDLDDEPSTAAAAAAAAGSARRKRLLRGGGGVRVASSSAVPPPSPPSPAPPAPTAAAAPMAAAAVPVPVPVVVAASSAAGGGGNGGPSAASSSGSGAAVASGNDISSSMVRR
jgi:hypothetical protein